MRNLESSYFRWLYSLVGNHRRSYLKLSKLLHERVFTWSVPNDDNRCEDGKGLRLLFLDLFNVNERSASARAFLEKECSVFEVLVGLARRIEDLMYDPQKEPRTAKWFEELLTNLKLSEFVDGFSPYDTFDESAQAFIHERLTVMMNRDYDYAGNGSLFPLKKRPPKNMQKVEIWYQLMLYMDENYNQ